MKNILSYKEFEKIKLNINIDDILLGGRWRNKKIKVKEISKDDNNQITINGKPLLKYRILKELPKEMQKKFIKE